jgi:hypothetical protein
MPKVEGTYPHSMTKEQAAAASKKAIAKLLSAFEATDTSVSSDGEDNLGFSCTSRGMKISGKIVVKDDSIDVTVAYPSARWLPVLVQAAMDKNIPNHLELGSPKT